ncbi:MAG: type II toxin-antitoxin system PemK/MazF family toxin [Acidimicrobiales bacterium]
MVIERGGIYWADRGTPTGSRPAKRQPVLVISADTYNRNRLATVLDAEVGTAPASLLDEVARGLRHVLGL